MWFTVHGMEVINRRNTKSNPCIENWKNYDDEILKKHLCNVKCKTPYQQEINASVSLCKSKKGMQLAKMGPDQHEDFGLQPPCHSIEKIEYSYVDHELDASIWSGEGNFWVELIFTYQRFREVTQSR